MDIIRYIVSGVLGLFGLYVIVMNWFILVKTIISKKFISYFPLFGGASLCIAILILPNNPYPWLGFFALVLDIGCLPLIICSLVGFAMEKYKKKKMRSKSD